MNDSEMGGVKFFLLNCMQLSKNVACPNVYDFCLAMIVFKQAMFGKIHCEKRSSITFIFFSEKTFFIWSRPVTDSLPGVYWNFKYFGTYSSFEEFSIAIIIYVDPHISGFFVQNSI
jgi:hypothetical protein